MNQALQLRKAIETCELPHPEFRKHADVLSRRIKDAIAGYSPRIERVIGPSRVGKTMLVNTIARPYPAQRIDGTRHVPVLVVNIPEGISPKMLPSSGLAALGVHLSPTTSRVGDLSSRFHQQLRLAGTKVLIFEEASHLVEPGARLPPSGAGDWFKTLVDTLNVTVIMFGVPRLERLFASNEPLRLRSSARREFRPYDARDRDEFRAFATCVQAYANLFLQHGFPIQLPLEKLVPHCYLLSGGRVGVLSRFMQDLADLMAHESPRPLNLEDCFMAARSVEGAGHPDYPPFTRLEVTSIELTQAHVHTLESSDMPVSQVAVSSRAF